jgi:hypothetical protein
VRQCAPVTHFLILDEILNLEGQLEATTSASGDLNSTTQNRRKS